MNNARIFLSILGLATLISLSNFSNYGRALIVYGADQNTINSLQQSIQDRNAQIKELDKEIKALNDQIVTTSKEGDSLKAAINALETSRAQLLKEIDSIQSKVGVASLNIQQLALEIQDKQIKIDNSKLALADTLRNINQAEDISLVENVLTHDNVSEVWNDIESLNSFQTGLSQNVTTVQDLKDQLSQKKTENETVKQNLVGLQNELQDKEKIVEINKTDKADLLSQTQNKEANFQKQLDQKKKQSEAFQQEITQFESQLKFIINPGSYPLPGKGILSWPLENITITQYFGDTAFAMSTKAYNGKGHNGVDFAASPGTKVMAALSGTIAGTGNTDLVSGCESYGKWILIQHDNGLSTIYAHLSLIKVTSGQRVSTGDTIAYSGNTGFTTGPHLHFGVYASQGVKIIKYTNSLHCKDAILPVADLQGYLNPMTYL